MTGSSALRDGAFLRLWIGTTSSGLATWALPFVLGLAVVDGTLSATELGLALAVRTVGFLAVLPVAGVVADRHSPRAVVSWSGAAAAVASLALVAGLATSIVLTCAAALVMGAGQGASRPAFQALVPLVAPIESRQSANAAISIAVRTSILVGPAAAGLLQTVVGTSWLVVGTGLLWLVAAVVPPSVRPRAPRTRARRVGFVAEFVEGVVEARRHPWFFSGLGALSAVIMTGYSVTAVALPLVSREETGSGALLAAGVTAYTAGALACGVALSRWTPQPAGWLALAGLAAYALPPIALALPGAPVAAVVAAYVVAGVGIELFNVPWYTATQREVAPDRLSRVSSLDFLVSYGLAPVGLALVAPAIDAWGSGAVLLGCSAICLTAPVAAAWVPSTRHFSIAATPEPRRTTFPSGP